MMKLLSIVVFALLLTSVSAVSAQDDRMIDPSQCTGETNAPAEVVAALDNLLDEYTNPDREDEVDYQMSAPGAVMRVETPNWIYYEAAGVDNLENGDLLNCEQPFPVGSNTKMMTATLILQLHEEGLLDIDDPLSDYLPEFAAQLPNGDQITIRQLTNHTSGTYDYVVDGVDGTPGFIQGGASDPELLVKGYTLEETIQFAIDHGEPYFEPGAEGMWQYSNTGYSLLGLIIEQVTGQDLATAYKERIFDPLSMDDSFLWLDVPQEDFNIPDGYSGSPFDLNLTNMNLSQGYAAGGVISTASDMAKFISGLLNGELYDNPETLALMQETVPAPAMFADYGIGLILRDYSLDPTSVRLVDGEVQLTEETNIDVLTWGHGGTTLGYETAVEYVPELGLSIVVLTNSGSDFAPRAAFVIEEALDEIGQLTPEE